MMIIARDNIFQKKPPPPAAVAMRRHSLNPSRIPIDQEVSCRSMEVSYSYRLSASASTKNSHPPCRSTAVQAQAAAHRHQS